MVDTKIIDVKPISKSDLKIIAPLILNFNSVEVATSIMSYTGASFLKERLKQEFNLKFPQLLIRGGSGAGKTETVERIIMPLFSYTSPIYSITGTTEYATQILLSSSNTLPVIFDGYYPHEMRRSKIRSVEKYLIASYENWSVERRRGTLVLSAPIILMGDFPVKNSEILERSLIVTFTREESYSHSEIFKELVGTNLLPKLGRSLLDQALRIKQAEIEDLLKEINEEVEELTRARNKKIEELTGRRGERIIALEISPRPLNTARIVSLGLCMIKRVFEENELDFEEETNFNISDLIKKIFYNVIKRD